VFKAMTIMVLGSAFKNIPAQSILSLSVFVCSDPTVRFELLTQSAREN